MLDKEWETKRLSGTFHVLGRRCQDVGRRGDPEGRTRLLHFDPTRFVALRCRPGERNAVFLERLNDLNAGNVLVGGTITEIKEEIEPFLDQPFDLTD